MNKKLVTIGTSIAVGSIMLVTTAFAGMAGTSGYDAFKTALKNTQQAKNITATVEFSMKDNEDILGSARGVIKADCESKAMSSEMTVKAAGEEKSFTTYKQGDKTITKSSDSDVYNVMEFDKNRISGHNKWEKDYNDEEAAKDIERVVDAVAGNFQNYISSTENADGTKEVLFQMSDNQISPVVNTVASAAFRAAARESTRKVEQDLNFGKNIQEAFPKLVEDIRISNVEVKAQVNKDEMIQKLNVNITITGKDSGANVHNIAVSADITLSDLGTTVPDTVNLEGKQVRTIDHMEKIKELEELKIKREQNRK